MYFKKYQEGGQMPPQMGDMPPQGDQMAPQPPQEGGAPTQLPPELQQILMSLPENVKKYIMSLPIEQQIQELQKVAQGQMQAAQNSPNQMMQQQMNQPPQQGMSPQGPPQMGRYGMKIKAGMGATGSMLANTGLMPGKGNTSMSKNTTNRLLYPSPVRGTNSNYFNNLNAKLNNTSTTAQSAVSQPNRQRIILDGKEGYLVTGDDGKQQFIPDTGAVQNFNQAKTYTQAQVTASNGVNTGNYYQTPQTSPVQSTPIPPATNTYQIPVKPKVTINKPNYTGTSKTTIKPAATNSNGTSNNNNSTNNSFDAINRTYTPNDDYIQRQIQDQPQATSPVRSGDVYYEKKIKNALQKLQRANQKGIVAQGLGFLSPQEAQKQYDDVLKEYEEYQQNPNTKKNIFGYYYRSGGSTKLQYGSSARIPKDELDPLYREYMQNVRGAGKNQYQQTKAERKYDKFDRKEQRRPDGSFLDRWAVRRRNKQAGKIAKNENQKFVDAYNANAAATDIGDKSGYPMRPIAPPNPATFTPRTNVNPVPGPVGPFTPVPKPTVTPVPVKPNTGGGKKGLSDFERAFAAARKAHGGPGGTFMWNGKEYTTDWAEEVGKNKGGNPNTGGAIVPPTTAQPAGPQNQQPNTPREQSYLEKEAREGAGMLGRGVMKVAEWLDPGSWVASGLKKLGMADKWADRIGTGVSVGSMFIPGLGVAGMVGKAGKVVKAGKAAKNLYAAETAARAALAGKNVSSATTAVRRALVAEPQVAAQLSKIAGSSLSRTQKLGKMENVLQKAYTATERGALAQATKAVRAGETLKYGPKFGEVGNKIAVGAENMLKKGINVAPGAYQIGAAGDAVSQGNDKEAIARGILGAGMGAIGVRKWGKINSSKPLREAQSNFRIINGKEHVLTKNGMWKPTVPANAASNSAEAAALKARGVKNLVPVSNSPGTYMDSVGNLFDKAGNWIGKAGTGIKNTGKSIASKFKKTPPATGPWSPATPSPGGTTIIVPKYGGQIYKTGGKMKIVTCKYGC